MKHNPGIIDDADLILVMEPSLMNDLPSGKTCLITECFGQSGAITNPWPDFNVGAQARYRNCLSQLRTLIEPNGDLLIGYLA